MNEKQSEANPQTLDPEIWVDQYGDYLYRYALSRIQDPSVAEDLVQETLLAALQAKEGFKGRSSEKTWLTGILKYKIIDHIRKKSRERPTDNIEFSVDAMHEDFDEKREWKVEKMPPDSDGNRAISMDEMGAIFDRIDQTIGKLEKECPANWDAEKVKLDHMICDIKERWSEASAASPDDFDG